MACNIRLEMPFILQNNDLKKNVYSKLYIFLYNFEFACRFDILN